MRNIVLLAVCFAVAAAAPEGIQRIVGGTVTTIDSYPSMVALLYSRSLTSYTLYCGGTILNNRAVLTSVNCVFHSSPVMWRGRVGSTYSANGGTVHNVDYIITHDDYNPFTTDNDIAVLRLASSISFNDQVRAVSLAGANYVVPDGATVVATGWGATQQGGPMSPDLRRVEINIISQDTCRERYVAIGREVTDNMICAGILDFGGKDHCIGDSGGPLYHENVQVGISSWGQGCALPNFPGVSTRVSRYIGWIEEQA